MDFGGAWTENEIEKHDSEGRFQSYVTARPYSEISGHSTGHSQRIKLTAANEIQLKALQLISQLDCITDRPHLCGI